MNFVVNSCARFLITELNYRGIAASQESLCIWQIIDFTVSSNKGLAIGHCGLGGTIHRHHQFIELIADRTGKQDRFCLLQYARQRDFYFFIIQGIILHTLKFGTMRGTLLV